MNKSSVYFSGIGAISGGGATSRLLVSYPDKQRSEILDLLFKPQFAASLQILKVEIGGDAQSTDGTEPSHRHTRDETPNFERGYEWWLMKEAKKRNPDILLWALPWGFPGWLDPTGRGNPYANPNATAAYVVEWVAGARDAHGLHIDMVGCWNERAWNGRYLAALRAALDANGLEQTSIVAPDAWVEQTAELAEAMLKDPELFKIVDVIGSHYPGTLSSDAARQVASSGKKLLFASEDYGVYFDASGAKAWARLLNQNFVKGAMSGTIAWNLVSSYYAPYKTAYYGPAEVLPGPAPYRSLPYRLCGLMHAAWPWAGHYVATAQLYATAHHTQFVTPGWRYLPVGLGSGLLDHGGSAVALTSPDGLGLTFIIEKMSWPGSQSAWQGLQKYDTSTENVTLALPNHQGAHLAFWKSVLPAGQQASGEDPTYLDDVFIRQPDLKVGRDGSLSIEVCVDCLFTITTELDKGFKGTFEPSPSTSSFPLPYADSFDNNALGSEPDYFADQAGSFEIVPNRDRRGNRSLRQMVVQKPCTWLDEQAPLSIIGDSNWTDTVASVDVMLEDDGVIWIGSRLQAGDDPVPPGPNPPTRTLSTGDLFLTNSTGVFLSLATLEQEWRVSLYPRGSAIARGPLPRRFVPWAWHRLELEVAGVLARGVMDSTELFSGLDISSCRHKHGFMAIGTDGFYPAQFDDLKIGGPSGLLVPAWEI